MSVAEVAGLVGGLLAAILTVYNIARARREHQAYEKQAIIDSSTIDEQRLTIVANSAQVATGFLQEVLKRADAELERRDERIEQLEGDLKRCREGRATPERAE